MSVIKKITLVSVISLALIGCSDTYSSGNSKGAANSNNGDLRSSKRVVNFLTDVEGMSLYTFDKDTLNKSNCLPGECQDTWPLFVGIDSGNADLKVLPGTQGHLAYRKHPLYYFINDNAVGDVNGNNVKEVWHLVHAPAAPADAQVKLSDTKIEQTYLADKDARTLYVFDKDTANVSNCYDSTPTSGEGCESVWPVFYSADLGNLPSGTTTADFGVIERDKTRAKEGEPTKQVTYKGKPLYYFTPDNKEALSTKGDWVKGVWHMVELDAKKVESGAAVTAPTEPTSNADIAAGKSRFEGSCFACHGKDGLQRPGGNASYKQIGTIGNATTIENLLHFMKSDGSGKNSTMVGIAQGLSDQDIKNVAAYIATLKK